MRKFVFFLMFFLIPIFLAIFSNEVYSFFYGKLNIKFKITYYDSWISNCLTIGSFVFAVQSFLIPFLKQSLYDSEKYKEYIVEKYGENSTSERYRPLRNLSDFLFTSTLLSFFSALFMFVFIITKTPAIIIISIYCGIVSFLGLICVLFLMKSNFSIMFSQNKENVT